MAPTDIAAIIISLTIVVAIILGIFIARNLEKKDFNKGRCRNCEGRLRCFDRDSQSGRGYICDTCGNVVWISYNVDKPKQHQM